MTQTKNLKLSQETLDVLDKIMNIYKSMGCSYGNYVPFTLSEDTIIKIALEDFHNKLAY